MHEMTFEGAVSDAITALEGIRIQARDQDGYMRLTRALDLLDAMRRFLIAQKTEENGVNENEHHD